MTLFYVRTKDGEVFVDRDGEKLVFVAFKDCKDRPSDVQFSLAVLTDALKDAERAKIINTRFMWRTIKVAAKGNDFRISLDKVLTIAADIETVETQTAMTRAMVAQEPPPVVSDRGQGVVWDQEH